MFRRWEGAEMGLEFTAENHIYRLEGVVIPSVTQIIKDAGLVNFDFISDELLAAKADLGNKVHKTAELNDKGILDYEDLHPKLRGYLDSWIKFRKDFGFIPSEIEMEYFHPLYRYAGKIDRVGTANGVLTLVDIKSGIKQKYHHVQLGGYKVLYDYDKAPKAKIKKRLIVHLSGTGYKIEECKSDSDMAVFLSCLSIYNFKKNI